MQVASSKLIKQKKPVLKQLLDRLLENYSYASVLMTDSKGKNYVISNSGIVIGENNMFMEQAYVVKVYDGTSYGEYAFNHIEEDNLDEIVAEIAEHVMPWSEKLPNGMEVKKYPEIPDEEICFEKSTEYGISPEDLGDEEVISRLKKVREKALAQSDKLIECQVRGMYQVYHKLFLSPKKDMTQNVMWTDAAMAGMAAKGEELKMAFDSCSGCAGVEVFDGLEEKIPSILEAIDNLLVSEPITPGEYECICAPDVTGMIVHEAFGHGVEMDMFVKKRALAEKYIGEYVASPLVTMHDGAAAASQTATYFFDDEGTVAQDTVIIEKGILKTGICDAQAGMALGTKPTGNGRRQNTGHKAYTRMTNTFFEPGTDKLEDMIASVKYGFFLEHATSGMEDPKNWGIQCMIDIAREIKDGKFTGKVFSPIVLTGYAPDLLKSISMMSEETVLSGSGMCGKGHKEWVKVSDGGPYIKAKIRLG